MYISHPSLTRWAPCLCMVAALFATGCGDNGGGENDGAGEAGDGNGDAIDTSPVEAALAAFPDGFAQVNDTPIATQGHAQASFVDVWVQAVGVEAYETVDPAATGSMPSFEEGTIVLKEQFDDADTVVGYTIMFKGPEDYAPQSGDWWWGFADSAGRITNEGQIDFCISCHTPRADDDWMFGVPTDNRL